MKITWLGHSCFTVESQGYKIVLDPYKDGSVPGLAPVREEADLVLCSHGHGDHCGTECVSLRQGTPSPFTAETIDTWHDNKKGALRGPNNHPHSERRAMPRRPSQRPGLRPYPGAKG